MSLTNFFPIAERNAIHSVVCALEWDPSHQVRDVDEVHRVVVSQLPNFSSQDVVSMTMRMPMGVANNLMPPAAQEKTGFILKNESGTHVITFADAKLLIQFNKYTRWVEIREDLGNYFSIFCNALGDGFPLIAWGQQVTDVFLWKDDPERLNLAEVFNADCKLFPSSVFSKKGLWHSHYGFVEEREKDFRGEYIENINLNRAEKSGVHAIQLVQAHRFKSKHPSHLGSQISSNQIVLWNDQFHENNKLNMRSIFSDEVLAKLENFSK